MRRCARREIDQIISLNRGREFVSTPPRKPRRTSITPIVRGIFSTRRRSNYCAGSVPPSLPFSCTARGRRVYFANISRLRVHTRRRGKPIDHVGVRELSTFCRAPLKKNCSRRKVSRNFGSWVAADLLLVSAIDASPVSRAPRNDLILLIKSNGKKIKF